MKSRLRLARDESGAAAVEMAFAVPILIVLIWAFVQLAEVYRAVAGIQQALGEGARYATLCLTQSATGCAAPTAAQIKTKIQSSVYGIGPGTFTVRDPASGTSGTCAGPSANRSSERTADNRRAIVDGASLPPGRARPSSAV